MNIDKLTDKAREVLEQNKAVLERYNKEKTFYLNHRQKIELEQVNRLLGFGFVNKSCGACLAKMLQTCYNAYKELNKQPDYYTLPYTELVELASNKGYDFKNGRSKDLLIEYLTNK